LASEIEELGKILAEQLLNNRLQMADSGATEKAVTLTKQTKIGLCEQVRVNAELAGVSDLTPARVTP
jgi:hypothetical protein